MAKRKDVPWPRQGVPGHRVTLFSHSGWIQPMAPLLLLSCQHGRQAGWLSASMTLATWSVADLFVFFETVLSYSVLVGCSCVFHS